MFSCLATRKPVCSNDGYWPGVFKLLVVSVFICSLGFVWWRFKRFAYISIIATLFETLTCNCYEVLPATGVHFLHMISPQHQHHTKCVVLSKFNLWTVLKIPSSRWVTRFKYDLLFSSTVWSIKSSVSSRTHFKTTYSCPSMVTLWM